MNHLIIADPIHTLKPVSDTTLVITREIQRRKGRVFWAIPSQLRYEKGQLRVQVVPVGKFSPDALPPTGTIRDFALKDFGLVWIRKDPPFDTEYLSLCWLLALEEGQVPMINRPSLLLRYHEKLIPFEAVAHGFLKPAEIIATHIGKDETARRFVQRGKMEWAISKPFFGYAGTDIRLFSPSNGIPETSELRLVQPFLADVGTRGDRRIFYFNGKIVGDFARLPKPGEVASNIAHGGTGRLSPMTKGEKGIAERLGRFIKRAGIDFAGADMIGARISEVNITSPTGFRTYAALSGKDIAPLLVDYAEALAQ